MGVLIEEDRPAPGDRVEVLPGRAPTLGHVALAEVRHHGEPAVVVVGLDVRGHPPYDLGHARRVGHVEAQPVHPGL